jgi:hypothetical protein
MPATAGADARPPAHPVATGEQHEAMKSSPLVAIGMSAGFASDSLKVSRVLAKVPQMLRTHSLDKLPYYITAGPDSNLLDWKLPVGKVASNGMSLTRGDVFMTRAASSIAPTLAAYQLVSGSLLLKNYVPGIGSEKPSDVVDTRLGRSAALQFAGGLWGSTLVARGIREAWKSPEIAGSGGSTLAKAGASLIGAGSTKVMLNPKLVKVGMASGLMIAANQFGYFDVLNRDDPRSVGTKLKDAVHGTWILNNSAMRPLALTAFGALGVANAATSFLPAMREGGGLSAAGLARGFAAVPKVKLGVAGGLLALAGVSALGGLDALNG